MAEAIGLLSALPVAVDDNALRVTASAANPINVTNAPTMERVDVDLTTTVGEYLAGNGCRGC